VLSWHLDGGTEKNHEYLYSITGKFQTQQECVVYPYSPYVFMAWFLIKPLLQVVTFFVALRRMLFANYSAYREFEFSQRKLCIWNSLERDKYFSIT
jgi:hypothetical protein